MIVHVLFASLLGVLTWTFTEYCVHRWLGHDKRFRGNPFGKEHIAHHVTGDYFAPWWKKALAAIAAFALLAGPAILLTNVVVGLAYVAGFVGAYLYYELLHRLLHVIPGTFGYGRWARRHHFYHHFVDARFNHGVTSPLWDYVFRTHRQPEVIPVPPKLMMPWLGDPETGVRPEFASMFELKQRPS